MSNRRILLMALCIFVVTIASICASLIPVMRKVLADREVNIAHRDAQRAMAKYAKGLTPCTYFTGDLDGWLQKYLSGRPDVSIDVEPSFSPQYAIRLVGQDLYYFEFDSPLYDASGSPPPKFNPPSKPIIYHSRFSSEIARQLSRVMRDDIDHAQATLGDGYDGTNYYLRMQKSCAMTWSPSQGTQAGDFVELSELLAQHAKARDATEIATNEQKILAILKRMQSS
ncbi:hypothetical protein [Dyella mobilis]|uniref:Uncharacterized protein n=1 Tax=Dyella mobilis TaxID=1849582 RepID=A0ABS2KCM7_9GAMM|nr:hypothetical protein [Dyella mobilis]MBM7128919.1 hypothetical protein [Dyella mobilis]